MKRKHLILLATPLLIGAILYSGRDALIIRSDALPPSPLAGEGGRAAVG